jgi:hypothetical protein
MAGVILKMAAAQGEYILPIFPFSFRPKKSPARKKALLPKMGYMCVGRFSQHRQRFY